MTHAHASPLSHHAASMGGHPHKPACPIVQYGARDEDDEYDSDDDSNRVGGLFGGMMHHKTNRKPSLNMGGVVASLGASLSRLNKTDDDSDSDDSVGSKNSVTQRAKQAMRGIGDSLRFSRHREREYDSDDSDSDDDSSDEEDDDDDESSDEDSDEMDESGRSVASRTAKAFGKVTGKLTQALKLKRDDESDSDEESSDEEEEEDPLADNTGNGRRPRGSFLGGFVIKTNKDQDNSEGSGSNNNHTGGLYGNRRRSSERESPVVKLNPFKGRRSSNERESDERESPVVKLNPFKGRRSSNERESAAKRMNPFGRRASNERVNPFRRSNSNDSPEEDRKGKPRALQRSNTADSPQVAPRQVRKARNHSCMASQLGQPPAARTSKPRSQSAYPVPHAAAKALANDPSEPPEAVWSMNVTEDMLKQATNEGVFVPPKKSKNAKRRKSKSKEHLRALVQN